MASGDHDGGSTAKVPEVLGWFDDEDPNAGSPWDKGERLAALVSKTRTLLVLDGMEPLQWGSGPEEGMDLGKVKP